MLPVFCILFQRKLTNRHRVYCLESRLSGCHHERPLPKAGVCRAQDRTTSWMTTRNCSSSLRQTPGGAGCARTMAVHLCPPSKAARVLVSWFSTRRKLETGHGHLRPPFYWPCGLAAHGTRKLAWAALNQCRFCLIQFVMLKPVLTLLPFVLEVCRRRDSAV